MKLIKIKYVVTAVAICLSATSMWAQTGNTNWYTADPEAVEFTISTAQELMGLAQLVNVGEDASVYGDEISFEGKTITLANDIDLAHYNWTPIGGGLYGPQGKAFEGVFDGNGKIIRNLRIVDNTYDTYESGLFGIIWGGGAVVKDLGLVDVDIRGGGG